MYYAKFAKKAQNSIKLRLIMISTRLKDFHVPSYDMYRYWGYVHDLTKPHPFPFNAAK